MQVAGLIRNALVTSLYALRRHSMEIPFPIQTIDVRTPKILAALAGGIRTDHPRTAPHIDFLRAMPENEVRLLVPSVQMHEFGAGETPVRQGDTGDSMCWSGAAKSKSSDALKRQSGKSPLCGDRKITGEAGMMTGEPRNATLRAQTDVEVLGASRESFSNGSRSIPKRSNRSARSSPIASERRELLKESGTDGVRARRNWWVAKVRQIFDIR